MLHAGRLRTSFPFSMVVAVARHFLFPFCKLAEKEYDA
jgi:hypothetical protein